MFIHSLAQVGIHYGPKPDSRKPAIYLAPFWAKRTALLHTRLWGQPAKTRTFWLGVNPTQQRPTLFDLCPDNCLGTLFWTHSHPRLAWGPTRGLGNFAPGLGTWFYTFALGHLY